MAFHLAHQLTQAFGFRGIHTGQGDQQRFGCKRPSYLQSTLITVGKGFAEAANADIVEPVAC